jgi:hypothetical protein
LDVILYEAINYNSAEELEHCKLLGTWEWRWSEEGGGLAGGLEEWVRILL